MNIKIKDINEALKWLEIELIDFMKVNSERVFTHAKGIHGVQDNYSRTSHELFNNDEELEKLRYKENNYPIHESLHFIRDQILAETGKRIWGLTFTLYPDGKYEIEYDYNIPEGFNEKGEYIGEQNFGEITEFFDNIRNIGTDEFKLK